VQHKPFVSIKNSSKKTYRNKNANINKGDVGHIKGHIGSYSDGVLKLRKSDLKKLNNSGNKKR